MVLLPIFYKEIWCYLYVIQVEIILIFQVKYVLKSESDFAYLILTIQSSAAVFLVIMQFISKKIGKKRTYYIGMINYFVILVSLFFVTKEYMVVVYILAACVGTKH